MSFSEALKGANRVLVSTHGQRLAHFSSLCLRQTSEANHTKFKQNVEIMGLL